MKKEYNKMTTGDIPLDASFTPSTSQTKPKTTTTAKPKINAIGKSTATRAKTTVQSKTSQSKIAKPKTEKTQTDISENKLRTKLTKSSADIQDLEKLNEENIKSYRFKSKRSKVVIVLLSVCLVLAIAAVAVYAVISKLETNCNMIVRGANATFIVDGDELSQFRAPSNLQGNSILTVDIRVRINEPGEFTIKFIPMCYQKGVLIDNTLIYEHNADLFYEGGDGYYYSKNTIEGNQTIKLCGGIIIDYNYKNTLNIDNFRLDFYVYFDKV